LDGDYVSQQFSKENNREYGKSYYVDTENFYSQGTFEVKTTLASSPLVYLEGTGLSGSFAERSANFEAYAEATANTSRTVNAFSSIRHFTTFVVSANANSLGQGTIIDTDFATRNVNAGDPIQYSVSSTDSGNYSFIKVTDSGATILDSGTAFSADLIYSITTSDISSTILEFRVEMSASD
jgi:hypothetical protein